MIFRKCFLSLSAFLMIFCLFGCAKQNPVKIDPFANIKIKETGWNGKGKISVKSNKSSYTGDDETIKKLMKSLDYDIENNENLKNGDKVTIKLKYDKDLKQRVNVKFKRTKYTYKVKNLVSDDGRTLKTEKKTYKDKNGKTKTGYTQSYVIDGVEIPTAWNLSDEEMQDYVQYVKNAQASEESSNGDLTSPAVEADVWSKGTAKKKTHRKNSTFYIRDYNWESTKCYNKALNYGKKSSQEYKIKAIQEDGRVMGYRTQFKDDPSTAKEDKKDQEAAQKAAEEAQQSAEESSETNTEENSNADGQTQDNAETNTGENNG